MSTSDSESIPEDNGIYLPPSDTSSEDSDGENHNDSYSNPYSSNNSETMLLNLNSILNKPNASEQDTFALRKTKISEAEAPSFLVTSKLEDPTRKKTSVAVPEKYKCRKFQRGYCRYSSDRSQPRDAPPACPYFHAHYIPDWADRNHFHYNSKDDGVYLLRIQSICKDWIYNVCKYEGGVEETKDISKAMENKEKPRCSRHHCFYGRHWFKEDRRGGNVPMASASGYHEDIKEEESHNDYSGYHSGYSKQHSNHSIRYYDPQKDLHGASFRKRQLKTEQPTATESKRHRGYHNCAPHFGRGGDIMIKQEVLESVPSTSITTSENLPYQEFFLSQNLILDIIFRVNQRPDLLSVI